MSQVSLLDEDLIAYSEMLPKWGSMRSGVIWPQPTWEPPTNANAFSFWPSTRAEDAESCGNHPNAEADSLTAATRNWETPRAGSSMENGNPQMDGPILAQQSSLWQTPGVDSFRSCGGDRKNEMGLDQEARMWPTPTEDNAKNNAGPSRSREDGYGDLTVAANHWPTIRPCSGERSSGANRTEFHRLWPTPTAQDDNKSSEAHLAMKERMKGGRRRATTSLQVLSRLWPTPQAHDSQQGKSPDQIQEMRRTTGAGVSNLNETVECWPTATAPDSKGSTPQRPYRSHLDQATEHIFSRQALAMNDGLKSSPPSRGSRRRLNPAFAAWLMGMPWFWTNPASINSAPSEMELWRCRLQWHFASLLRDSFTPSVTELHEENES
jgi:hypothetical protein